MHSPTAFFGNFTMLASLLTMSLAACHQARTATPAQPPTAQATTAQSTTVQAQATRPSTAGNEHPARMVDGTMGGHGETSRTGAVVANTQLPTAQDQSNQAADLEITRTIREDLTNNSAMSLRARAGTTIVTQQNVVTLRGEVASNLEREAIGIWPAPRAVCIMSTTSWLSPAELNPYMRNRPC